MEVYSQATTYAHYLGTDREAFWKVVCTQMPWIYQSKLINPTIVKTLAEYLIRARYRAKKYGTQVPSSLHLSLSATAIDVFMRRLVELGLYDLIPVIDEDGARDGDGDEDKDPEFEGFLQSQDPEELDRLGYGHHVSESARFSQAEFVEESWVPVEVDDEAAIMDDMKRTFDVGHLYATVPAKVTFSLTSNLWLGDGYGRSNHR